MMMPHATPIGDVHAAAVASNALSFELGADGHPWVSFRDGWGAARFLLELARQDARRDWVRDMAHYLLIEAGGDPEKFARSLQAFGQGLPFFHEVGEIFQGPWLTISRGGDCDCHARLIYALASAGGLPSELAFLHRGDGPTHVLARVLLGGQWRPLETTVRAHFGEDPIAAAKRLRVVRDDLNAPETITMGELTENVLRVAPDHTYRMRIHVDQARDSLAAIDVRLFLSLAVEAMGFHDASVCLDPNELDDGWPVPDRDPLPLEPPAWTAWAKGTWRHAETTLDRKVGSGPLSFVIASADESSALTIAPDAAPTVRELAAKTMGSVHQIVHTADLSDAFFAGLVAMCARLGCNPIDMLAVMNLESGGVHHWAHNLDGTPDDERDDAWGLNQIMSFHLNAQPNALGWPAGKPAHEFIALNEEQQLPFVERYFRPYTGHLGDVGAIYAVNFLPGRMQQRGSSPGTILTSAGEQYYERNRVLDYDGDGNITIEDLANVAKSRAHGARWDEMVARAGGGTWSGGYTSKVGSLAEMAVLLVGGGVLAAMARELHLIAR